MDKYSYKILLTVSTFLSLVLLLPGITHAMLNITMLGHAKSQFFRIDFGVLDKSASILDTVTELMKADNYTPALLIFFFSICVPILKSVLVVCGTWIHSPKHQQAIVSLLHKIGKWSMADVFVVAIFLVFLSTRSAPSVSSTELQLMGFELNLDISLMLSSKLQDGFYFFLSYCLLSIMSLALFQHILPKDNTQNLPH